MPMKNKKKNRRQVKKVTLRPLPLARHEVQAKHGVGMRFEFNTNVTPALKIAERLEALVVHLAVVTLSLFLGTYYALRGQDFTNVTYRD